MIAFINWKREFRLKPRNLRFFLTSCIVVMYDLNLIRLHKLSPTEENVHMRKQTVCKCSQKVMGAFVTYWLTFLVTNH